MNETNQTTHFNRPEPILTDISVFPYKQGTDPQLAVEVLLEGSYVLIMDFYSSGLKILQQLKKHLGSKKGNQSFSEQQDARAVFRKLSHQLLLEVNNHKLTVRKAPDIGWLKILYPEHPEFLLPFPQIQGLNSSWQWYQKGVFIPVLNRAIHPYYGTYFPTRFEHLTLFEDWLKQYRGNKESAYDIGLGCGVLSFQLLNHGFNQVWGTDSNANVIIGMGEDPVQQKLSSKFNLFYGDLFANQEMKADLIVFNPPWLPATHQLTGMDDAIYYEENMFPRFFAEAATHLNPDGRIIMLFSNLAEITMQGVQHPIRASLSETSSFEKELFLQKQVGAASKKTKRNQHWRSEEKVELWVLKKRQQ